VLVRWSLSWFGERAFVGITWSALPAWLSYRSWSRVTSGVLLSVIGAVQYGTSKAFYKIVPVWSKNSNLV
jgi:hypothetical protein